MSATNKQWDQQLKEEFINGINDEMMMVQIMKQLTTIRKHG